ncbi:MAG TPA: hypothetical protein VG939_19855 [Caulobacteraceae bacterium]|nr:hypothetical protein [Caulobacteraceae bacterium]
MKPPRSPSAPNRPSEVLDPAVLERYLLLLSLDLEAERMLAEHRRQIAEIERAHAAGEPIPQP